MDCKEFDRYVDSYFDQMLDEEKKGGFEEHLTQCIGCQRTFDETRRVISLIKKMEEKPLPQNFRTNLIKEIKGQKVVRSKDWIRWASALAGVLVIGISITIVKNVGFLVKNFKDNAPKKGIIDNGKDSLSGKDDHEPGDYEASIDSYPMEEVTGDGDEDRYKEKNDEDLKSEAGQIYRDEIEKKIESDKVEVYVQDVCITPQTLKFMADNNNLEWIVSDDESITFKILSEEQRKILYRELSKMGKVKETGEKIGGDEVKITIKKAR